jgi:putative ABC transport system permease protein
MNLFQLSWKNLINKPLSMTLSLVLFALGVGLVSFVFLLNKQVDRQFRRNLEGINMVIGAKGSPLQLVLNSIFHLGTPTGNISIGEAKAFLRPGHPLIEKAIPLSLGDGYKGYRIVGTTPQLAAHYGIKVAEGKLWEDLMEVTVGHTAAEKLGLKLGDEFQSYHGLDLNENLIHEDAHPFKVVGILEKSGMALDQVILTSTESVWAVHDEHAEGEEHDHAPADSTTVADAHAGHDHGPQIPLHEREDESITAILIKFKAQNARTINLPRMINENTNMMAANPSYQIDTLLQQLGTGEKILRLLGFVILIVSSFSIFISLLNSLKDRRYELAIMRTLGASPGKLTVLIILEGLILATLGYALGIFLSHAGLELMQRNMPDTYRYDLSGFQFMPEELMLLAGALAVGLLAALFPAIQAGRTDISTTLSEG